MKVVRRLLQPFLFAPNSPLQQDPGSPGGNLETLRVTTETFIREEEKRDLHDEAEEADLPLDAVKKQLSKFNDSWKLGKGICAPDAAAIDILAQNLIKLSVLLFQRSKSNEEVDSASARFMCRHLSLDLQVKQ